MSAAYDTSSFVSATSGAEGAGDDRDWAADDKEPNCPKCDVPFTMWNRRHHCRNCRGLVCDQCSPHQLPLPSNPGAGKVRICNDCEPKIGQGHVLNAEEELHESVEALRRIKGALRRQEQECATAAAALLDIESAAEGGRTATADDSKNGPAFDAQALESLRAKWASASEGLSEARRKHEELLHRSTKEHQRHVAAEADHARALEEKSEADRKYEELNRLRREIDDYESQEGNLSSDVQEAENEFRLVVMECAGQQQPPRRAGRAFLCLEWPSAALAARGEPQSFAVSIGRSPPTSQGHDRLQACRRQCVVM
mmetsp:Transcript_78682/g.228350  ORF Transcript_78682/g.228350 Transcript_78682/m.228350 type:complete len:312 (+) Transcript_78682:91-1026(+)